MVIILILRAVSEVRYIQNKNERMKILKACHLDPTSGHLGVKHTLSRITERFMWPGVSKDVEWLISYGYFSMVHDKGTAMLLF